MNKLLFYARAMSLFIISATTYATKPPQIAEKLFNFIDKGDLESIKKLCLHLEQQKQCQKNGCQLCSKKHKKNNIPLLSYAVGKNKKDIAIYLITKGQSPNDAETDGTTPLFYAQTVEMAQYLVQHGAECGVISKPKIVDDEGASVTSKLTPLMKAVDENNKELAQYFISLNCSIQGTLPYAQTPEMADFLIEKGAKPLQMKKIVFKTCDNKKTLKISLPYVAIAKNYTKLIDYYYEKHIKPGCQIAELIIYNDQNEEEAKQSITDIMTAARFDCVDTIKKIINKCPELIYDKREGDTPWMRIAYHNPNASILSFIKQYQAQKVENKCPACLHKINNEKNYALSSYECVHFLCTDCKKQITQKAIADKKTAACPYCAKPMDEYDAGLVRYLNF